MEIRNSRGHKDDDQLAKAQQKIMADLNNDHSNDNIDEDYNIIGSSPIYSNIIKAKKDNNSKLV